MKIRSLKFCLLGFSFTMVFTCMALPKYVAGSLCEIEITNFHDKTIKSWGSGCILKDGNKTYLYSNAHVLLGGALKVTNMLGQVIKLGKPQLLEDDSRDMIRFEVDSKYSLSIGDKPLPGSKIFSFGNAGGNGIVSKEGQFIEMGENHDVLHTIPVIGGDSGGPIFNQENKVFALVWGSMKGGGIGASFEALKWLERSSDSFFEFSKVCSKAKVNADFWYKKTFHFLSSEYIYAKRQEWLPKMQKMLNITNRERVSEAYKIEKVKDTLGLISNKDQFLSSLDLLYAFVPLPIEIRNTTGAIIKYHADLEIENLGRLEDSLPENSWLRENLVEQYKGKFLKVSNWIDLNLQDSNHDLDLFVGSVKNKRWIKVDGEFVPVISLPFLGRFWDAFYKKFYTGKNFGRRKSINSKLYLGPAYLEHICSHQWKNGAYQHGILNKGKQSTALTITALQHMYAKIDRIKFNPNNWRPEWGENLRKGVIEGHINGMTIPEFLNSVSPVIRENMILKAEEYMLEVHNDAEVASWLSFLKPEGFDVLSAKAKNDPNWLHAKHSRLVEGIEHVDPVNRKTYYEQK